MIRTGRQYLDSIRDGREVYINGTRVADVARHPMFKPLVDIRARIYDMQHEGGTRNTLAYLEGAQPIGRTSAWRPMRSSMRSAAS